MRRWTLLLCIATAAVSGCTVGPDYQRPDLPIAPAFRGPGSVTPLVPGGGWWRTFEDATLDRQIERALTSNLDLAQAIARVTQARAASAAAGAARLPAIESSGSVTGTRQSLEGPLGTVISRSPGFDRNGAQFDAGIGAAWEIDLFGGLQRGFQAAQADLLASEAGVIGARQIIAAEVADAYIQLRSAQVRQSIAKARANDDLRLRDLVAMTVRAGISPSRDLDLAEAQLEETRSLLPALRLSAEVQMNRISVLAGQLSESERRELEVPSEIPAGETVSLGLPVEMLRNRPDLIVAEMRLVAANARIGQAMSEYYPKFSLRALLGLQSSDLTALPSGNAITGSTVFGLRWRLFDFGRLDTEVAAARGREAELLAAYRLTVLRATEDVENAAATRRDREAQRERISARTQSLERSVNALQGGYQAGTIRLIDVIGARRELSVARDAEAQLTAEVSRAAIAIARAVGA